MNIIFDRKATASRGSRRDPDNTPEKLVSRRRAMLAKIGKFIGADSIEFREPTERTEHYIITKEGKTLTLTVSGNAFDGGWLNVK